MEVAGAAGAAMDRPRASPHVEPSTRLGTGRRSARCSGGTWSGRHVHGAPGSPS